MTGMKEGAGENPFADDDSEEQSASEVTTESTAPTATTVEDETAGTSTNRESTAEESNRGTASTETESRADGTQSGGGLPWKYSRDSVKADRSMVQFFLQEGTTELERRTQASVEDRIGENVMLIDVREAAYQVALENHVDEIVDQLREWGYDFE